MAVASYVGLAYVISPAAAMHLVAGGDVSLMTIMKGIWIFLIPLTLGVVLLIAFPSISTILPNFMSC